MYKIPIYQIVYIIKLFIILILHRTYVKIRDSEKIEDFPENAEKEYLAGHSEVDSQTWELGKKAFENYTIAIQKDSTTR